MPVSRHRKWLSRILTVWAIEPCLLFILIPFLRSAHLMGVAGYAYLPSEFTFQDSLDSFSSVLCKILFINKVIDATSNTKTFQKTWKETNESKDLIVHSSEDKNRCDVFMTDGSYLMFFGLTRPNRKISERPGCGEKREHHEKQWENLRISGITIHSSRTGH